MSDIIVHQSENMIINVFGMHIDFIILHVSTIMEVLCCAVQNGDHEVMVATTRGRRNEVSPKIFWAGSVSYLHYTIQTEIEYKYIGNEKRVGVGRGKENLKRFCKRHSM